MSKVRIYGDVSGYVDIAVPDNAGTTTLNLDKIPQADINGNIAMDTNTLYVDAANNRVGVGTASPNTTLDIVSPSSAEAVNIRGRSADDIGQLKFYENDGTTSLARLDSRTTHFEVGSYNELRFSAGGVGNSHVVINTSGNVGIGITAPTASWGDGTGVQFNPVGEVLASKVNGTSLYLNRTSSSGSNRAVISINENSSNIGTIGMGSGSELAISTNAGTQYISQKLNGDTDGVQYSNVGTYHFGPWISKNATVDLGRSSSGWRDLYLTGGIQFDARSNKLDDYETGTYSPTFVPASGSFTSIPFSSDGRFGRYTIVGNRCYFEIKLETASTGLVVGTASGAVYVSLPFTAATVTNYSYKAAATVSYSAYWSSQKNPQSADVYGGTSNLLLWHRATGTSLPSSLQVSDMDTTVGGWYNRVRLFGHYELA